MSANVQPDVKMMTVHEKVGKALTADEEKKLLDACAKMAKRYGHIGDEAHRAALAALVRPQRQEGEIVDAQDVKAS